MQIDHEPLFPLSLLGTLIPNAADEEAAFTFGGEIEKYISNLVSHLKSYRSHNSLIRNAIVSIAPETTASSVVTTRDACKTLRNFSGHSVPDVTSIIQVTTSGTHPSANVSNTNGPSVVTTPIMPVTPSGTSAIPDLIVEEPGTAGAAGGIGIGAIIREKKSVAPSLPLPPKQPKKRGRPSNKDRGIPPLPKKS